MKRLVLGIVALGLSGCGGGSSDAPNENTYNLRAINKTVNISTLLKGSYSNGTKGSLFLSTADEGNDIINGVSVKKIKSSTSITLDNGYTSQNSSISLIDNNGFALAFDDATAYCTLTSSAKVIPTNAKIGATSSGTSIYSCDDGTNRTSSWKLTNANNGNANYIFKTIISGASQSESTSTITITPANKIIHYKINVNIIAQSLTGVFEGDVN
jgi:hypothetical protein